MSYEPIGRYHLALLDEERLDDFVRDFAVMSFKTDIPYNMSRLERELVSGRSAHRKDDLTMGYPARGRLRIFDHAALFKRHDGSVFLLTLPYNTPGGFYQDFDEFMAGYLSRKLYMRRYLDELAKPHYARLWDEQLNSFGRGDTRIEAEVLDDRYKVRRNGDFAAVIATVSTLRGMGLR